MYKKQVFSLIFLSIFYVTKCFCTPPQQEFLFDAMEYFEQGNFQKAASIFKFYAGKPCPVAEPYCLDLLKKGFLLSFTPVPSNGGHLEKEKARLWYEAPKKLKALLRQKPKLFVRTLKEIEEGGNGPLLYLIGKLYETGMGKVTADPIKAQHYFLLAIQGGDPRGILGLKKLCPEREISFSGSSLKTEQLAKPFALRSVANKDEGEVLRSMSGFYHQNKTYKNEKMSQYFLHAAAQFGHTESQFKWGKKNCQSEAETLFWMMNAAENNHLKAIGLCAHFFEQGIGIPKDYQTAYVYLNCAAHHPEANSIDYYNFALLHETGKGTEMDYNIAHIWYKKAYKADPKNLSAITDYGRILGLIGQYSKAKKYLEQVKNRDDKVSYNFACALIKEVEEREMPAEALEILQRLAGRGELVAFSALAKFVIEEKINLDLEALQKSFEIGIQREEDPNIISLAYLSLYLLRCRENSLPSVIKQNIDLLKKALHYDSGNIEAKLAYAKSLKELGDFDQALQYFLEIERSEGTVVFNDIGACYDLKALSQINFPKRSLSLEKKAYRYYLKQLEAGESKDRSIAAYNLACLHFQKKAGLNEETPLVLKYLEIAAAGKVREALNDLGTAYHFGLYGAEVDLEKAKYFYQEAIKEGEVRSKINLGILLCLEESFTKESDQAHSIFIELFHENENIAIEWVDRIMAIIRSASKVKEENPKEPFLLNEKEPVSVEVEREQGSDVLTAPTENIAKPNIAKTLKKVSKNTPVTPPKNLSRLSRTSPLKETIDEDESQKYHKKVARLMGKLEALKSSKQHKYRKVKTLIGQFIQTHGGHLKGGKGSGQRLKVGGNFSGFHRPHGTDLKGGALVGISELLSSINNNPEKECN
jgi:TPR repeat protein